MRGKGCSIGIVTIFDCDNYGAELQAYALPRALAAMGHDARLIDYPFYKSPRFRRTPLAAPVLPLSPANWLKERLMAARTATGRRLAAGVGRRRAAAFAAFRDQIPRTRPYATFDALVAAPPACDVYLTGSDQVWNPRMGATLRPYFLDFLPEDARRIAYAASFGVGTLAPPVAAQYRRWLARYEAVGCREASGVALMQRLCPEVPAAQTLDPTLLLDAADWRTAAAPPPLDEPYLLVYELVAAPGLRALAHRWAQALGVPIVRLCGHLADRPHPGAHTIRDAGPAEFLGLFANATAVLTTSFHGTAFALLFGKPFYSVIPRGMANAGRQRSLLETVGLADRLLPEADAAGTRPAAAPDWAAAHTRLAAARVASRDFLAKALEGGFRRAP